MTRIKTLAIIISIPILFCGQTSFGQVNLDSMFAIWNDPNQPDTIRLLAMHDIAWEGYLFTQPDSAFYYAQLEYDFALLKGLKKQMASALNTQGASFYFKSDYDSAIHYFIKCLSIKEEMFDKQGVAAVSSNIGLLYFEQGNFASAIEYHTRSLRIDEEMDDKLGIASSLNNIGNIYYAQQDYTTAKDYYKRSLNISEEIGYKAGIASALGNIGTIYKDQGKHTKALDHFNRSLTICQEVDDKYEIGNTLNNIGLIYSEEGNYADALDFFTRSLTTREEFGDKNGMANSLNSIGNIYREQANYKKALSYSMHALKIAQEAGVILEIKNAAENLYDIYKSTGKNKSALEMYELYITTRDSITSEKNQKEIIRQKFKYDYEKQAIADSIAYIQIQKIQEAKLEKSRILQYALIGGVTLLLVFLGYVFNRFRVTQKQKLIISDQNKELAIATEKSEAANIESQKKSKELEKFNNVMLDREMRIIELKKEINKLANENNKECPYPEVDKE